MNVLITGITGMIGSHLAEYLLTKPYLNIHGTVRWQESRQHIKGIENSLSLHGCDLTDAHGVTAIIKKIQPELIFHLAAETSVASSWDNPVETISNNITCELNLFEAIRRHCPQARILIAGSSESYGLVSEDQLPVKENTEFKPLSPYGVSKVSQDVLAYQYYKSYGMSIIRTRIFNLTGPRQNATFALANFAKQLALIAAGKMKPILHVGNLDACRDFTDFRDAVKAFWLAMELCQPGEAYNIGSGKSRQLKTALDLLVDISGINVVLERDPNRMRPSDIPHMVCDNTRFCDETGWYPEIPFKQTLKDLFSYWKAAAEKTP